MRAACLCLVLLVSGLQQSVMGSDEVPAQLESALKNYETEFLRELAPVQQKYMTALQGYLREFAQSGNLKAAKEAQTEIEQVKLWKTIPLERNMGARSLQDPQLNDLQSNYEGAALKLIEPVTIRFLENLNRLKQSYVAAQELDAALLVDAQIKAAIEGKSLPVEAGARNYLSTLSKEEFGVWIQQQLFEFSGAVAGRTLLKFGADRVTYGSGANAPLYEYRLAGTRKIEINGGVGEGGFTMDFSKDLHSGKFTSLRAEYPLVINPDRPDKDE